MTSQFLSPIWKIDWLADPLFSFKASVQIESRRVTFNPSRDVGHKFEVLRGGCRGAAGRVPLVGLHPRWMPDPGASTKPSGSEGVCFPFSSGSCQLGWALTPLAVLTCCRCLGGLIPSHAKAQVPLLLSLPCASRICPCSSGFCTDPQPLQVKEFKSCPSNQL